MFCQRINDNGRRVIDFCVKKKLSTSNTYFEHRSLLKCTRVATDQDEVHVKNMIDLRYL